MSSETSFVAARQHGDYLSALLLLTACRSRPVRVALQGDTIGARG